MCRRIQIILTGIMLSLSLNASAQNILAGLATKSDFDRIYQSMVSTIRSEASVEEKLKVIHNKDEEYLSLAKKIMLASDKNPAITKDPTYAYFWELYYKVIPFLKLKLNAQTKSVTEESCLEASRLVMVPVLEKSEEPGLGGLALEDATTAELLARLCQ